MSKFIRMLVLLLCANIGAINAQNLTYSQKEFAENGDVDCYSDKKCPQIKLKIAWFDIKNTKNNAGSNINERIFEAVLESSYIHFLKKYPIDYKSYYVFGWQSYQYFAAAFVDDFAQQQELGAKSNEPFSKTAVDVSTEVTYNEKKLLNVVVTYRNNLADWVRNDYGKVSLLFDPKTGYEPDFYEDIIFDKDSFTKVATKHLKDYGVNYFKQPTQYIVTADKVILYYASSPVPDDGTYADFELEIPINDVKQYLNKNYF